MGYTVTYKGTFEFSIETDIYESSRATDLARVHYDKFLEFANDFFNYESKNSYGTAELKKTEFSLDEYRTITRLD